MKEIYRSGELAKVGLLASLLRNEGIAIFIRNEQLSVSDAQIPSFFPALCITDESQEELARQLLERFLEEEKQPLGPDWICPHCQETVPSSMAECWSCQRKP